MSGLLEVSPPKTESFPVGVDNCGNPMAVELICNVPNTTRAANNIDLLHDISELW